MENHKPEYVNASTLAQRAKVFHGTIARLLMKGIITHDAVAGLGSENHQYLFLSSRLDELVDTIKKKGRTKKSPVFYD